MDQSKWDLCVIGAGSGGVRAARMAAQKGAKVAIIEEKFLGGTCVNVGCVPKKLFVYASEFREHFHDSEGYGWTLASQDFQWKKLLQGKKAEIERLNGVYDKLLTNAGVSLIRGKAQLQGAHTVQVGSQMVEASQILIATGSKPYIPDFPGSEHVLSSDHMFYLEELPRKLLIAGGGYIATEFACIMNGLGVSVTMLQRSARILGNFDQEVGEFVSKEMQEKGISIMTNETIASVSKNPDHSLLVSLNSGESMQVDHILNATGRVPNISGLGLEQLGLELTAKKTIKVNSQFQSSIPSIYALGDVIGTMQLTPVAIAEAMVFVDNLYGSKQNKSADYNLIPTAVFSQPQIGTVGLSEEEACSQYAHVDIYTTSFTTLKSSLSSRKDRVLMKMLVNRDDDRVVGVHIVAHDAGEMIQGVAVALKAGACKSDFDDTVGIHPTSAEEFVTLRTVTRSSDR